MTLSPGMLLVAQRWQEAAAGMMASDVRSRLQDAVKDAHKGSGTYAYYLDHAGDGESGDCIYATEDGTYSAPYDFSGSKAAINTSQKQAVKPSISYETEPDADDEMARMEEAFKNASPYYRETRFDERFISKSERDGADSEDFAGKGKSFPILKAEDVAAAAHALGRAGPKNSSTNSIKSRIIAIAKRKGFALPKAWQDDSGDAKESAVVTFEGEFVKLREGAVGQDGTALLKVIAPGWGSSGYYSPEVLARDLPKIYPAGTKQFWDHATDAEESARPEGSLRNVASVSREPVKYMANGPDGPGGYAKVSVVEDFRQPVDDLAKLGALGVSIRASGKGAAGTAPDGKKGMIITSLERGQSYDYVTEPGAGGKVLQLFESARRRQAQADNPTEGGDADMTDAEVKKMQERLNALEADNRKFRERAALTDAGTIVGQRFGTFNAPEDIKRRVMSRVLATDPPLKENGSLDEDKLTKFAEAELKDECAYVEKLTGQKIVVGMGTADAQQISEADRKKADEVAALEGNDFAEAMGFANAKTAGGAILREGRGAFRIDYNSGAGDRVTSGVGVND